MYFQEDGLFYSQLWGATGSVQISPGFQQGLVQGCSERVATKQLAFSCAAEKLNEWAERLGCPLAHRWDVARGRGGLAETVRYTCACFPYNEPKQKALLVTGVQSHTFQLRFEALSPLRTVLMMRGHAMEGSD